MPDSPSTQKTQNPTMLRILWLIGSLIIGYAIGNIIFMLPFAAALYFLVPDTKWNAGWTRWRKLQVSWRAVIAVGVMYLTVFIFLAAFGPWLTAGMGQ